MGYPPQNPQYPQQPGQPYGQPPQQGYGQPPQQGQYVPGGPPQGAPYGAPEGVAQAFDFGQLYGQADPTAGSIDNGTYPAIVESAEFDRTQAGNKWAWTVKFRISVAPYVGRRRTKTLSINPTKRDGSQNGVGLGITFRQIHALGVPLGPPIGQPGETPVWQQVPPQGTPDQILAAAGRLAAQMMTGRPCRIVLGTREAHGDYAESQEIKDIKPPAAGDPTSLPAEAMQDGADRLRPVASSRRKPGRAWLGSWTAAPPASPQGYPQPGAQPVGQAAAPPWGAQPGQPVYPQQGPPQQGYPAQQAPAPYGAPPGSFPGQVAPQGTPQGPPQQWADPNGQPAQGPPQAAPQGQPAAAAPPWANGQPAPQQGPPQGQQPGTPPAPPWAQQQ